MKTCYRKRPGRPLYKKRPGRRHRKPGFSVIFLKHHRMNHIKPHEGRNAPYSVRSGAPRGYISPVFCFCLVIIHEMTNQRAKQDKRIVRHAMSDNSPGTIQRCRILLLFLPEDLSDSHDQTGGQCRTLSDKKRPCRKAQSQAKKGYKWTLILYQKKARHIADFPKGDSRCKLKI